MKDDEHRTDADLLLAARTSAEPFGVFYERHFASVLAFFRRRTPGPEEAFDLTAETFAAALAAVPRYTRMRPGPSGRLFAEDDGNFRVPSLSGSGGARYSVFR